MIAQKSPMRVLHIVFGLGVLVLAAAGCGDDVAGGDASSGGGAEQTTTTDEGPPVTQVAASEDPERALEQVQGVADEDERIGEQMFADPTAALEDPESDLLEQYRELWTPDSEAPDSVESRLQDFADRGHAIAAGPSGMVGDWYLYNPTADGADVLRFRYCVVEDRKAIDLGTGEVLGTSAVARYGEGEANRVNGVWRLHAVDEVEEPQDLVAEELFPEYCETGVELLEQLDDDGSGEA